MTTNLAGPPLGPHPDFPESGAVPWRERHPVVFALTVTVVGPVALLASQVSLVGGYTVAKLCRRPVAAAVVAVVAMVGAAATWFAAGRVMTGFRGGQPGAGSGRR